MHTVQRIAECHIVHNVHNYLQQQQRQESAASAAAAAMQKLVAEEEQAVAKVAAKKAKKDRQKAKKQQAKQTVDAPSFSEPAEELPVDLAGSVPALMPLAHAAMQPHSIAAGPSIDTKLAETYIDHDKIPAVYASQTCADRGSCTQSQQATTLSPGSPQSTVAQLCSLSSQTQGTSAVQAAAAGVVESTMPVAQSNPAARECVPYPDSLPNQQQPETLVDESLQQLLSCPITKVSLSGPIAQRTYAMQSLCACC